MIYFRHFNYWRFLYRVVIGCIALAVIMSALGWSLMVAEILRKVIIGR